MLESYQDCIPLSSSSITQSGNYLLFEEAFDLGKDIETYHFKILIAGASLNASDVGIMSQVDNLLRKTDRQNLCDATLKVRSLSLSQISEGLFVYEMKLELKVRR